MRLLNINSHFASISETRLCQLHWGTNGKGMRTSVASRKVEQPIQYPGTRYTNIKVYKSKVNKEYCLYDSSATASELGFPPFEISWRISSCRKVDSTTFDTNVARVTVIKNEGSGRLKDKEEEASAVTRSSESSRSSRSKQREWKKSEKDLMRFVRSGTPCLSTHADYLASCHAILLCAHAHVSRTTWQIGLASVRESEQPARCGWYSYGRVYDNINELVSLSPPSSLFSPPSLKPSLSHLTPIYHSLSFLTSSLLSAVLHRNDACTGATFKVTDLGTWPSPPYSSPLLPSSDEMRARPRGPEKISYGSSLRHCTSKTNSRCVLQLLALHSWRYWIRYNASKGCWLIIILIFQEKVILNFKSCSQLLPL